MIDRIIVGYADTPGGHDALAMGVALAALGPATELVVATVYPSKPSPMDRGVPDWRATLAERARAQLSTARDRHPDGPRTTFRLIAGTSPAEGLHRLANELRAGVVVVGVGHEHGLGRVIAGSVTEQTLHGSPCAVAIAPSGYADSPEPALRTIVVADDGSPAAAKARDVAVSLARDAGADLELVGVSDVTAIWYGAPMAPGIAVDLRETILGRLEEERTAIEGVEHISVRCVEGQPVTALRTVAQDADLLVLGSRNHGLFGRTLLGSVSSPLVRRPPCPMLVVPRCAATPAERHAELDAEPVVG